MYYHESFFQCSGKKQFVNIKFSINISFKYRWLLLLSFLCVLNASTDNKPQNVVHDFKFALLDSVCRQSLIYCLINVFYYCQKIMLKIKNPGWSQLFQAICFSLNSINTFLPSNLKSYERNPIRYSSKDYSNAEFRNVFVRKKRHSVYISFVICE